MKAKLLKENIKYYLNNNVLKLIMALSFILNLEKKIQLNQIKVL